MDRFAAQVAKVSVLNGNSTAVRELKQTVLVSGFFRRSIRTNRNYFCSYNNNCVIKREFRNCCRSCRLRKCIAIGMNAKLVHSDRGALAKTTKQIERSGDSYGELPSPTSSVSTITTLPSAPDSVMNCNVSSTSLMLSPGSSSSFDPQSAFNATIFNPWLPVKNEFNWQTFRDTSLFINSSTAMMEADQLPLGVRSWIPLFSRTDVDSVVRYYITVDQILDRFAEYEHINHVFAPQSVYPVNMSMDLMKAFIEPRSMMGRSRIDWSMMYPITGGLERIWLRVGMYYIDWMSHVPELSKLSLDDRMRLTAGRSMACIWAIVAQRSAVNMNKKGIALSGSVYYPLDRNDEKNVDQTIVKFMGTLTHFLWTDVVEQIRRLQITDAEMILLRILTLLSGVPCMSPEGREIVREANSYYMSVLFKIVQETVGSPEKVPSRLCDLMSLLPAFEKAANLQDDGFGIMSLSDIAGLGSNLISDYHLRKSYRL
ncbi:hypothetical protein M3Y95_00178800 [Aphelenchoides besseyi]|nr:hypothetical protein M3Y95_00178800 [Aphelenchoides besseyi]